MMRSLRSFTLFNGLLVLALFASCQTDKEAREPELNCISGRVLGLSCNGMLIQVEEGVSIGRTITYRDTLRQNVIGAYAELPAWAEPGKKFTFALRRPTAQEEAPRPCLAIYQTFDVPQMVVEPARCIK